MSENLSGTWKPVLGQCLSTPIAQRKAEPDSPVSYENTTAGRIGVPRLKHFPELPGVPSTQISSELDAQITL